MEVTKESNAIVLANAAFGDPSECCSASKELNQPLGRA